MDRRFQERPRVQPHQAAIAALARRQQHDPRRRRGQRIARVGVLVAEIDRELAADDRLDAIAGQLVGEFQRPEHVVGVGQRQRRLAVRLGEFRQLLDLDRSLQQRIGGMDVEMDKSGTGLTCRRLGGHGWAQSLGLRGRQAALREPTRASMVMPAPRGVHAEPAIVARRPAFPQGGRPACRSEPMCGAASELRHQLRPDRDHPDKQHNRSQCCRLFHECLQHTRLPAPEHMKNIVLILFQK